MAPSLTTQPMTPAVPPARNASSSSMQSPPARAEATRVMILSPVLDRPGARPRSRRRTTSWGRPRCKARVAGRISPALSTRRWSSKEIWMWSGWLRGSIYCVLLCIWDNGFPNTKPPPAQEHFLPLQHAETLIFSVDWGLCMDERLGHRLDICMDERLGHQLDNGGCYRQCVNSGTRSGDHSYQNRPGHSDYQILF